MSHYVIYCRKSTESEERQVLSIESQVNELRQLAERLHLKVEDVLTESKSAKYPGRCIFNDLMKRVSKREVNGIICWKLDRLARNPLDGSSLIWALDQNMISAIITPSNTFTNNSNDKFLMQLEFGMAKKYVDDLSDNVKRGNRAKLEKGILPGLAPLGYLNEPKERTIVPDPERFSLVRKLWDLLLQGVRPSEIIRIANEEWGFRTKTCGKTIGKPLGRSTFYSIFEKPFYYGLIERKEGIFRGTHEPMITEEEFWKAQELLGRRGRQRPKQHTFPFTGLIKCAECGCMITAEEKLNRYGYHYAYYRCTKKKGTCSQRYINSKELDQQVLKSLAELFVHDNLLQTSLDHLEKEIHEEKEKLALIKKSQEKALQDCQRKIDNLNQMRLNNLIDDDEYLREKRKLLDERLGLEQKMNCPDGASTKASILAKEVFSFAHTAVEKFQNETPEAKRAILEHLGSNFQLKDKKLLFDMEKPFLMIKNCLRDSNDGNGRLESQIEGFKEGEIEYFVSNIPVWCALVDNVRTFFLNKLTGKEE